MKDQAQARLTGCEEAGLSQCGDSGAPIYARQQRKVSMSDHNMNECIDNCIKCAAVCVETVKHCLTKGGQHASPEHIGLLQTCADICTVSANAMLRGIEGHKVTCGACAEICRQCAEACERMGDDEAMRRCAEACRRCAESCAQMASM